jgi:hypothetical protein
MPKDIVLAGAVIGATIAGTISHTATIIHRRTSSRASNALAISEHVFLI